MQEEIKFDLALRKKIDGCNYFVTYRYIPSHKLSLNDWEDGVVTAQAKPCCHPRRASVQGDTNLYAKSPYAQIIQYATQIQHNYQK